VFNAALITMAKAWNQSKYPLIYVHNGIIFSLTREGNSAVCNNMPFATKPHNMLSEIRQTWKDKYDLTYVELQKVTLLFITRRMPFKCLTIENDK
jgi:hypothetical protein